MIPLQKYLALLSVEASIRGFVIFCVIIVSRLHESDGFNGRIVNSNIRNLILLSWDRTASQHILRHSVIAPMTFASKGELWEPI